MKRFCAPLRCSWVYFGVYWVTWNLFRDAFRGFEGSLEGPKAVFIDYWSLFGCSSKGSSGSLGASFGALTQNIDIYGTSSLTLTPFWRPKATIHRYLRWIRAWAKIRYGFATGSTRKEPRPPSPLPGPLPRSRINSLPPYKPSGETLTLL